MIDILTCYKLKERSNTCSAGKTGVLDQFMRLVTETEITETTVFLR